MQPNQSLHITIKEPPNPEPVKTLGIFTSTPEPLLLNIVSSFLSEVTPAKSEEFSGNVKDEVYKVLRHGTILTVSRSNGVLTITVKE
jgi:hypothetical protein